MLSESGSPLLEAISLHSFRVNDHLFSLDQSLVLINTLYICLGPKNILIKNGKLGRNWLHTEFL